MLAENGKLIVFSAPSGSGKTTIVRYLLSREELSLDFSISATSRDPRSHEVDGEDYYFMNLKDFKSHIKSDDFLEWEEVYRDNFYGTLKKKLNAFGQKANMLFLILMSLAAWISSGFTQNAPWLFL